MAALPDSNRSPPTYHDVSMQRVEAWTVSQTADLLRATSITAHSSPPRPVRGTSVGIDIPLDEPPHPDPALARSPAPRATEAVHTVYKRREPIRRDSLKRREALLRGQEGSRRRRRWENDHLLLSNPHATPPLPADWSVQPTHRSHAVPYFLAPLWDAEYARRARERGRREEMARVEDARAEEAAAERVARELRAKLKRAKGAKGLLQDLEEEVRTFVRQWEVKEKEMERDGEIDADSEDDEIVFVGRNGVMSDEMKKEDDERTATLEKDKLVFESLLDDHGAAFGRYLVHAIGIYYGLKTWSVTTGNPARREAYVGLKMDPKTRRPSLTRSHMPQPLWTAV